MKNAKKKLGTYLLFWSLVLRRSSWSVAIGFSALFWAACSEDAATEKITEVAGSGVEVVSDVSQLPGCSSKNDGEMVWVKNETTPRVCSDGKWYAIAEGSVAATCSTELLPDGLGVKIICGGDSIGVVLNGVDGRDGTDGKDGADGEPGLQGVPGQKGDKGDAGAPGNDGADGKNGEDSAPGASCYMEKMDELMVRVICGEDSATLYVGEAPDTTARDSVELDSEKIAISLDEVSGLTQKGPFLSGSKVLVREMADGRTLTQTGNSFNGKILNDNGEFRINARMLVSQYVMLEATGYYRNEVTGENSNSELTLFAISDVNDRNVVNVNLLTHLEYERVVYLVTQKKMKVKAAKKQAQKEVFALLDIDATNFSNSEDLNIAGSSDEDGALLAFSLVLQGDRSVAELSELLTKIATDMEKDGVWNDSIARFAVVDWAADADSAGRLADIRENVKGWGISAMVPNFEKYVHHFWETEYALDTCNASHVGLVDSAHAGPRGKTTTRFICKDVDGNYSWFMANNLEKDTYGWPDTTDGATKRGDVTATIYVFDEAGSNGNKGWRLADKTEILFGGCNAARYGEVVGDLWYGGFFQCQEATHRWESISSNQHLLIETSLWEENDDGFSRWGEISWTGTSARACYVYDTSSVYNGWREGNEYDCSLGLMGCTKGRLGLLRKTKSGNFYTCINEGDNYYAWRLVEEKVLINTTGWSCLDTNDGEMRKGQENDAYFICEDYEWREATATEEKNCVVNGVCKVRACNAKKRGAFDERDSGLYVCDGDWRLANAAEKKMGSLCTANDSAVIWELEDLGNFKIDYICSGDSWHAIQLPMEYTLADWNKKKTEYFTTGAHPDAVFGEDLVDKRDGNVYKTAIIGGKRWMAENLRYADSVTSVNLKGSISCSSCDIMGVSYSWSAAMNLDQKWNEAVAGGMISLPRRGTCPEGWHIPDTLEWKVLANSTSYASLQMKGFSGWTTATNASGFSALPSNYTYWGGVVVSTEFLTATECTDSEDSYECGSRAYVFYISSADGASVSKMGDWYRSKRSNSWFVRCIQDYAVDP